MSVIRLDPSSPEAADLKNQAKPVPVRVSYMWMKFLTPLMLVLTALGGVMTDAYITLSNQIKQEMEIANSKLEGPKFTSQWVAFALNESAGLTWTLPLIDGTATVEKIELFLNDINGTGRGPFTPTLGTDGVYTYQFQQYQDLLNEDGDQYSRPRVVVTLKSEDGTLNERTVHSRFRLSPK